VAEEAMRILEQGASNLQGSGEGSAEAVSTLMLAMSTLLYRRYDALQYSFLQSKALNLSKFVAAAPKLGPDKLFIVSCCLDYISVCTPIRKEFRHSNHYQMNKRI
jgi:hypothetical protein